MLDQTIRPFRISNRPIPKRPGDISRRGNLNFTLPKRTNVRSVREQKDSLKNWANELQPSPIKPEPIRLSAANLTKQNLTRVRKILDSSTPLLEMTRGQKMDPADIAGVLYVTGIVHEYARVKAEYQRTRRATTDPRKKQSLDEAWGKLTKEFINGLSRAGLSCSPNEMDSMARLLATNQASYRPILKLFEGAKDLGEVTGSRSPLAAWKPVQRATPAIQDYYISTEMVKNWCHVNIEDTFTFQWSESFEIKMDISYPCGVKLWPPSIKWCTRELTLIAGSVSFSLDVGYRINCCGGQIWGTCSAEACGQVTGVKVCAKCGAEVAGVVGLSRITGADNNCMYGLGITIDAQCKLAGYTVLRKPIPFGWKITAPCPTITC